MSKVPLFELWLECQRHLQQLEKLFKPHCRLTLVMRNPQSVDGDLVLTRDDLQCVEDTIRRLREKEPQ